MNSVYKFQWIFSDHNAIKLEIINKKPTKKFSYALINKTNTHVLMHSKQFMGQRRNYSENLKIIVNDSSAQLLETTLIVLNKYLY